MNLMSVLAALAAYLIGSLSFAVIVSRAMGLSDPRTYGSGNPGATNVLRSGSKPAAIVTLLLDAAKGWLPVMLVKWFGPAWGLGEGTQALAGLAAFLGHMFPVFFGFKGGKGILSGGTLVWLLDWRVGLIAWGLFAALWLLTKYVSLGSVCAAASMPVTTFFFCGQSILYTVLAVLIAALVIWCHRENITRLLHHQERKFQWHTGTPKEKE